MMVLQEGDTCVSDVFQLVLGHGALQPVLGPAGFNAGPLLQQTIILGQPGVVLLR